MIALQESNYRKENRLWLLLARKKNINKKRLLTMSVCEEILVPFYFFSFLVTSLRKPKIPKYLFLLSLFLLWTPTILTLYVNTTLFPSFTLTNLFLARKCPVISVFENLVQCDHLKGSPDVTFFTILPRLYEQLSIK